MLRTSCACNNDRREEEKKTWKKKKPKRRERNKSRNYSPTRVSGDFRRLGSSAVPRRGGVFLPEHIPLFKNVPQQPKSWLTYGKIYIEFKVNEWESGAFFCGHSFRFAEHCRTQRRPCHRWDLRAVPSWGRLTPQQHSTAVSILRSSYLRDHQVLFLSLPLFLSFAFCNLLRKYIQFLIPFSRQLFETDIFCAFISGYFFQKYQLMVRLVFTTFLIVLILFDIYGLNL